MEQLKEQLKERLKEWLKEWLMDSLYLHHQQEFPVGNTDHWLNHILNHTGNPNHHHHNTIDYTLNMYHFHPSTHFDLLGRISYHRNFDSTIDQLYINLYQYSFGRIIHHHTIMNSLLVGLVAIFHPFYFLLYFMWLVVLEELEVLVEQDQDLVLQWLLQLEPS